MRRFTVVNGTTELFSAFEHDDGSIHVYNLPPHDDTGKPVVMFFPGSAYEQLEAWVVRQDPDAAIRDGGPAAIPG